MNQPHTRIIELDPFFDRGDASPSPALQALQHQPVVAGYGAGGYAQVDHLTASNMRPSAAGLRGTIIPRATIGGIPLGTQPHATHDVIVHIDPHIPNQSTTLRLDDINARTVSQALQVVSQMTPEPTDIATVRLRGSAMMHAISQQTQGGFSARDAAPVVPQAMQQPQFAQQPFPQPQAQAPAQRPAVRRVVSPLAAFNQPRQQQTRELREIDIPYDAPLPSSPQQVGPPAVQVVFEMEHFGTLPVSYHDVIVQEGFIVLVFDTRHAGSTKYFPPTPRGETIPRMAINVVGTQEVYLVQTTGVQFEHDSREFCILMIEQSGDME